jgi:hypothetical protein
MSDPAPGELTERRRETHGDWHRTAHVAQGLKAQLHHYLRQQVPLLTDGQVEALDMILVKIARIVSGDPNHPDHWHDIAGYAELGRTSGDTP